MKKKLVAIAAAAVAMVPLTGSPAHASVTGEIAFVCNARLPEFPSPQANGTCGPTSSASGSVSGVDDDDSEPYTLAAAGVNNFSASFEYQEACLAGEPPVLGTANGEALVTGFTGVKGGAPTSATAMLDFTWQRVGVTAVIQIVDVTITFADGDTASNITPGVAEAAFIPVVTLANTCPNGGPLTAVVVGTATFGA